MSNRRIKIEDWKQEAGAGPVAAMIRLKGRWLQAAGFNPGAHVEVVSEQPGVMTLRVCSPVEVAASDPEFARVLGVLDGALRKHDERATAGKEVGK